MDLIGSGSESYVGISDETGYGTRIVTNNDAIEFISEGFRHDRGRAAPSDSINRALPTYARRLPGTHRGRLSTEAFCEGSELLLKYALGDHTSTTNPDATNGVYLHTFQLGRYNGLRPDGTNTSATIHVGRGSLGGAGRVYSYFGALPTRMSVSFGQQDSGRIDTDWLFYDSTIPVSPPTAPTMATLASKQLVWPTKHTFNISDSTSGTPALSDVKLVQLNFEVNTGLDHEFTAGLNGGTAYPLPLPPHRPNAISVSGTVQFIDVCSSDSFDSRTLEARMSDGILSYLQFRAYGETITDSTYPYQHIINFDGVRIDEIDPGVDGPGPVMRTMAFHCDGINSAYNLPGEALWWRIYNSRGIIGDYSFT